jgi:hypothetical protein
MIYDDHLTELSRQHMVTVSGFCRSCRETEIFDRYLVTGINEITGTQESRSVQVCQGCGFEEPGRAHT